MLAVAIHELQLPITLCFSVQELELSSRIVVSYNSRSFDPNHGYRLHPLQLRPDYNMLSQSWATVFLLAASVASQNVPSLLDALQAEGAAQFATLIQSDPDLLALYTSGQVRTVFAPADSASKSASLKERALSPREQRAAKYQAAKAETSVIEASQSLPGLTIETADESPLLDSQGNVVVADSRPNKPSNGTGSARRWDSHVNARDQSNETSQSLLKISSGLGNIANVIKGDIPFEGGLIHITDR
jgi:hypothetical protein